MIEDSGIFGLCVFKARMMPCALPCALYGSRARVCGRITVHVYPNVRGSGKSQRTRSHLFCGSDVLDDQKTLYFLPMLYNGIVNDSEHIEAGLGVGCSKMQCFALGCARREQNSDVYCLSINAPATSSKLKETSLRSHRT